MSMNTEKVEWLQLAIDDRFTPPERYLFISNTPVSSVRGVTSTREPFMTFTVTWWVNFWEQDPELDYLVDEKFDADDLDGLIDQLDEGLESLEWAPENQIDNAFELGSFNIEYAVIRDEQGAEVYRQDGFSESTLSLAAHIT